MFVDQLNLEGFQVLVGGSESRLGGNSKAGVDWPEVAAEDSAGGP